MHAKYVIFEGEIPCVFSAFITHSDFLKMGKIISAGFCHITENGEFGCYGGSISLQVKSRIQDGEILTRHLSNY